MRYIFTFKKADNSRLNSHIISKYQLDISKWRMVKGLKRSGMKGVSIAEIRKLLPGDSILIKYDNGSCEITVTA